MREVFRGLRRFCIVTLGAAVRALNLLGVRGGYPRASTGIEVFALGGASEKRLPGWQARPTEPRWSPR